MTEPISLTRVLKAPRETVWREWTDPHRFADWFGGAQSEVPPSSVAMDVHVGGTWQAAMHTSGGTISWHGEYLGVLEPHWLVFTLSTQPPPNPSHAIVSAAFAELDDGQTEILFVHRSTLSPAQTSAARYGWARSFDRLAQRLATT